MESLGFELVTSSSQDDGRGPAGDGVAVAVGGGVPAARGRCAEGSGALGLGPCAGRSHRGALGALELAGWGARARSSSEVRTAKAGAVQKTRGVASSVAVARVARTISESAALLSGWMMDSYASGKYSWKRVKITPVSANKLDSS